jgi:fucose permease
VQLVVVSGIGSALGCAVLLLSNSIAMMAAGAIIVGLSFAAIYPTVLAMAADRYQRLAGTIFGLLIAFGLIGGMSFPWALGHISEAYGVRSGMVIPLVGSIMISVLVLIIGARERKSSHASAT